MATVQWQLTRFANRLQLGGDALLAVALASLIAASAVAASGASVPMRLLGALAAAGLLTLTQRRRRPVLVLIACFVVVFVEELAVPHAFEVATFLTIMVACYSLGAHAPRRALALGVALGVPGVIIGHALGKARHESDASADAFFIVILVLGPVLVGRLVRARVELADRLRSATERLAAARSERVAATVAADRERLGERIDAAVADGLGRMVELGECATLEQLTALEGIAREVLGQLRSVLGDLRAEREPLEPARRLADVHLRVQRAIAAEAMGEATPTGVIPVPRRWALLPPRLVDMGLALLAAGLTAGLLTATLGDHGLRGPRPLDALLTIAVTAPIAWARRFPLAATVVSILAMFCFVAVAAPADPTTSPTPVSGLLPTGALVVLPLALGAGCTARAATTGLVLCLAAAGLTDVVDPAASFDPTTAGPSFALVLGAWTAGRVLRDRSHMLGALADTAEAIEDEHRRLARAELTTERLRAARELHDAVAHAMTVIVLGAGAARRVWDSDRELAKRHLQTVRGTVNELIVELRGMVGALSGADMPTAEGLEPLIDRARASGIPVRLNVTGNRWTLAPALSHTAYRVLQEALTNATRHAPGAEVSVQLDFGPHGLALQVSNPTVRLPGPGAGGGNGLNGMRERVEACGGRLVAGSQPPDRFAVRAWLPCP